MRIFYFLVSSLLLLTSAVNTSIAKDYAASNYEKLKEDVEKARSFADFSAEYQKHLEMKDARKKAVRGTFYGDFKFKESYCPTAGFSGGVSSRIQGGINNSSDEECDCPKGTSKLGCLVSAKSITKFAKEDMGGVGYVMLFVDDGDSTYLLIDNKWQDFIAIRKGKSTYTVANIENKPYEYNIPFNRNLCGNTSSTILPASTKSYRILAGYGVADTKDLEYLKRSKEFGEAFESDEAFLWSSARLDGFRMRNAKQIGFVTCY